MQDIFNTRSHLSEQALVQSFCTASTQQIPLHAAPAFLLASSMMAWGMDIMNFGNEATRALMGEPASHHILRGDRGPVLVLPGFMADDESTEALRHFVHREGYTVYPWYHGTNAGPNGETISHLEKLLHEIYEYEGEKVNLIGWSMGGIFAQEMRRKFPHMINSVITLGSPHSALPGEEHIPVPVTSLYSRADTVVQDWRDCIYPGHRHMDVGGSHMDLIKNPKAFQAISWVLTEDQDNTPSASTSTAQYRPPQHQFS